MPTIGSHLAGAHEIDATDCYVIPGGVDNHVHLQLPMGDLVSADSFSTGTIAAACGGTTTIIDFATPQPEQSMLGTLGTRRAEADGNIAIDYSLHMTIPTWHGADVARLTEIPQVIAAGCATFKMYQAYAGYIWMMKRFSARYKPWAKPVATLCCTPKRARCWTCCGCKRWPLVTQRRSGMNAHGRRTWKTDRRTAPPNWRIWPIARSLFSMSVVQKPYSEIGARTATRC